MDNRPIRIIVCNDVRLNYPHACATFRLIVCKLKPFNKGAWIGGVFVSEGEEKVDTSSMHALHSLLLLQVMLWVTMVCDMDIFSFLLQSSLAQPCPFMVQPCTICLGIGEHFPL